MYIKVLVPEINDETYEKICNHYNNTKEAEETPIQRLDRAEGGFKIELPKNEWKIDPRFKYANENEKIRQLRWYKGRLVSSGYKGFTLKQYMLLYESLVVVLPPGTVILEN
jgi:hypothetical protein